MFHVHDTTTLVSVVSNDPTFFHTDPSVSSVTSCDQQCDPVPFIPLPRDAGLAGDDVCPMGGVFYKMAFPGPWRGGLVLFPEPHLEEEVVAWRLYTLNTHPNIEYCVERGIALFLPTSPSTTKTCLLPAPRSPSRALRALGGIGRAAWPAANRTVTGPTETHKNRRRPSQ